MLKPRTVFSKAISGAGSWAVRYLDFGLPSFCAVLDGSCRLSVDGHAPITIQQGDFILLPSTPSFTMSSFAPAVPTVIDPRSAIPTEEVRHGDQGVPADVWILGGYFISDTPNAELLIALLPTLVHVSGSSRLSTLVQMVREESTDQKAGCDQALPKLVELLMIEALRLSSTLDAAPGLLKGLSDARLAPAIRKMHEEVDHPWTVEQLAVESSMSRSSFFEHFARVVGIPPIEYLLNWRMAMAKSMLRESGLGVAEVADRVGYASASAFSTAFRRHVGLAPRDYADGLKPKMTPA